MRTALFLSFGVAVVLAGPAHAASRYPVTPQAGPWMICVTCYEGDDAHTLAEELCEGIRRDYKLPAYTFDRGAEKKQQEAERVASFRKKQADFLTQVGAGADTKVRGVRGYRVEEQCAVLVGGYKDMETARKELDGIKKLKPSQAKHYRATFQIKPDASGTPQPKVEYLNPFTQAIVAHNPSVPNEKPKAEDKFDGKWLDVYNDGNPYSLLKCKKPYTLMVMYYEGASATVPVSVKTDSILSMFKFSEGKALRAAEQQSQELGRVLTKAGYEAYVLHTEMVSYVCVGSFDRPDDARLKQMQGAFTAPQSGPLAQLYALKQLRDAPMPMPVPKAK